jgi:small subunit ribosomal protein S17
MEDTTRNTRRERIGVVTSNSMDKSIVVVVKRKVKHPIYGKFVNKSSKFMAHDEENTANTGDTVKISETRPLSKNKRWRLVEIIERAK